MARRSRKSRRSRKHLKGLGAMDTGTLTLLVGGAVLLGVGAYFYFSGDDTALPPDAGAGGGYLPSGGAGAGGAVGGGCMHLDKFPQGTQSDYKKYGFQRGSDPSDKCFYGWNGYATVIWGNDPSAMFGPR